AFSATILLATVGLFVLVPKGFLPSEDNSQIFGTTETVQGTSFDDLVRHQEQVMAVLQQDPNVDATMSFLGTGQINQGRVFMQLKPRSQRSMSVDELLRYFNHKLASRSRKRCTTATGHVRSRRSTRRRISIGW